MDHPFIQPQPNGQSIRKDRRLFGGVTLSDKRAMCLSHSLPPCRFPEKQLGTPIHERASINRPYHCLSFKTNIIHGDIHQPGISGERPTDASRAVPIGTVATAAAQTGYITFMAG
ncbi:hypothetical protein [Sedimentitalea nanhaiensis]|uniref:hypothetical protein n=1 Tax=Sedimentitalea nanhaiensis TaxID=999627 RepID=UPI00048A2623|nr:hypothetical protein [Sedimentitalea nanhaiensis]